MEEDISVKMKKRAFAGYGIEHQQVIFYIIRLVRLMIIRRLTVDEDAFSPCRCSPPLGRGVLFTIGLMSLSCVYCSVLSAPKQFFAKGRVSRP